MQEREDRAADVTIWLRAGVNKEGQSGGLGDGESRICYVDDGRTEVPLWQFTRYDALADDYYLQDGDCVDAHALRLRERHLQPRLPELLRALLPDLRQGLRTVSTAPSTAG